jgi:hypothetical protein
MLYLVDVLDIPTPGSPSKRPARLLASYDIESQNEAEAQSLALTRFHESKPLGNYDTLIAKVRSTGMEAS